MGPEATVDFMARVIALTPADSDQAHVPMLVYNNPQVPDRQQAMRDGHGGPVRQALAASARRLAGGGADFWVMPCNTAHAFVQDAIDAAAIPFVSIIDVTIESLPARSPGLRRVGLLATDACIAAGVYQEAIADTAMTLVLPDKAAQDECMALIFRVKSGDTGALVRERIAALAEALVQQGAEAIIAGCTEIPLVLSDDNISVPLVSSTDELARRTVEHATGARALPPAR
jgi:aspartate racemase